MMLGGGGDGDALSRMSMMSSLPLQLNPGSIEMPSVSQKRDDRVPQWSHQETMEFISIRAELEKDFTITKRNKTLWEIVAAKMKERGYRRTPDQCKCKWKNLVNKYKVKTHGGNARRYGCKNRGILLIIIEARDGEIFRNLYEELKASSGETNCMVRAEKASLMLQADFSCCLGRC